IVLVAAWAAFAARIRTLVRLLLAGQPESRFGHIGERVKYFVLLVLGQRGVLRDPLPGIAHFFTFWGFIIIQLDALNLWAEGFNFTLPVVTSRPFAILLDFFVIMAFLAIIVFTFRRVVLRPRALRSATHGMADAFTILGMIFLVVATLFFFEVFAYIASGGRDWTAFGALLGSAWSSVPPKTAATIASVFWWGNVLTVLAFLIYIPNSKHLHLLASPFNVFFRRVRRIGALDPISNLEEREDYGVHKVEQFTWKQLLDGYACTECGRCNSVCPALATDKPLWPKEIILSVKEELFAKGHMLLVSHEGNEEVAETQPMVGGLIALESLWACTNCGACVEICPVSIDHVQKIDDMRRYLVLEESNFPQEVTPLFQNLERNQNPWEISNDTRADWAKAVGVKTLAEDPDVEVLYWVGCMGSFDARNRKVATAFAKVMQHAGVSFGILGPEESCTGDPARRIGNEYLWYMLATQNVEVLNGYGFNKPELAAENGQNGANGHNGAGEATGRINTTAAPTNAAQPVTLGPLPGRAYNVKTVVATCPHCFNTIKNEYPQLGGNYEVVHHTEFIARLIETGALKLPEGFDRRKLTYHDPCFIGRWNGIYDEPRRVLNVINSNGVTEMRRNRNRSFCCGGGGGRVWMEEKIGKRINNTRVEEAISTGAEELAAACPFCITMFEDGIKAVGAQESFGVEDIAEILARALDAQPVAAGGESAGAGGAHA
ncbi:MAG TPA: heterodisulfide reductase-related iron-sulfur binding cluster, partial [Ktedonobacterales bacterium]|nr:heterodisulfide reductase-related iron-sulfur binding cluster [Ktedonobacterales bacterium]